jgi:hypothetical protein
VRAAAPPFNSDLCSQSAETIEHLLLCLLQGSLVSASTSGGVSVYICPVQEEASLAEWWLRLRKQNSQGTCQGFILTVLSYWWLG